MKRSVSVALALWLLSTACMSAYATRYEMPLPSSQEAQASLSQYRLLLRSHPDRKQAKRCQVAPKARDSRCLPMAASDAHTTAVGDLVVTAPPTLARLALQWDYDDYGFDGLLVGLTWLPEDLVLEPRGLAGQLARMSAKPYGCIENQCLSIEQVFDPHLPGRLSYALCKRRSNNIVGPPEHCVQMATYIDGRWWYRAWQGHYALGGGGRTDFIYYMDSHKGEAGQLRRILTDVLAAPPWILRDDGDGNVLQASADRRASPIVPPLRENLTIRISFNHYNTDTQNSVSFAVATTFYVNELNTSAQEDWHLPKPEVEQRYLEALRQAIRTAMLKNCPSPVWHDSRRLECDGKGESRPDEPPNAAEASWGLVREITREKATQGQQRER
jgi:hypothetical protein